MLLESKLLDQFITYCTTFGSKPCCFKDLSNYFIKLLDSNSAKDLLEKVHVSLSLQPEQSTGELNHYDNVSCRIHWNCMGHVSDM